MGFETHFLVNLAVVVGEKLAAIDGEEEGNRFNLRFQNDGRGRETAGLIRDNGLGPIMVVSAWGCTPKRVVLIAICLNLLEKKYLILFFLF